MKKYLLAISLICLLHAGVDSCAAAPAACTAQKIAEVLAPASEAAPTVRIDCNLNLSSNNVITKRMIFEGAASSDVTVNCNSAKLDGGVGTVNYKKDMIEVRSEKFMDPAAGTSKWIRPENITVRNCDITGSVRVWGMAANGQGADLRDSSRLPGHVERARKNAPTKIIFDNLTITGVGRIPLYLAPGVTYSEILASEIKGNSVSVAVYLDAESYGNTIRNNSIHAVTRREAIAMDGSGFNRIIGNRFSNLDNGGIYLYRNCGEGGTIRHSTPENNTISDNLFYYDRQTEDTPAVYLGSRNGKAFYCNADKGFPYGSSVSDLDYARHNIVDRNRIFNRPIEGAIRTNNPAVNSPNYIRDNVAVEADH